MSGEKPFSPSCERNRAPILAVLIERFAGRHEVLEVGSGTGQHAVHFAAAMPWLRWQCSDRAGYLAGIRMWLDEARLANTPPPLELDVAVGPWPTPLPAPAVDVSRALTPTLVRQRESEHRHEQDQQPARFDAAFTANSLHIMGWPEVEAFFGGLDTVLASEATLAVYGPFNVGGAFSSDSNRAFDASLRSRDPRMGIRDLEAVDALARAIGLRMLDDVAMPADNRCVVWRRG